VTVQSKPLLDAMRRGLEQLPEVAEVLELLGNGGGGSLVVTTADGEQTAVVLKPFVVDAEG
jgi:hypothetical protein